VNEIKEMMDVRVVDEPKDPDPDWDDLDPNLPKHPFIMGMNAPRNRGKTNLIINLVTREEAWGGKFDVIYLWTPSLHSDKKWQGRDWKQFMRRMGDYLIMRSTWEPEQIMQIIDDIKHIKNKNLKPRVLIIIDDMITENNCMSNLQMGPIELLAARGRHVNISAVITSQQYPKFSTIVRDNCTYWVIFRCTNREMKKFSMENAGMLEEDQFVDVYQQATEKSKHDFLYIHNECEDDEDKYRRGFYEILTPRVGTKEERRRTKKARKTIYK